MHKNHILMLTSLFTFLAFVALAPLPVSALTIGVPGDQPTIQAGIDAASVGDTVLVQPGRYLETIDFKGKDIVVGSLFIATQDTSYISQTIIDGNKNGTVVTFKTGETKKAELCGVTVTGGYVKWVDGWEGFYVETPGGGIICNKASPYLHHLVVRDNETYYDGGGMDLKESNSVIVYCVIKNNRAVGGGGGLNLRDGNHQITNCIIDKNNSNYGGGADCSYSKVLFNKVLMINNRSNAMVISLSDMNIINCTIANNDPEIYIFNSNGNIINSIFWNISPQIIINDQDEYPVSHVTVSYSDFKNGKNSINNWAITNGRLLWEEGNIESDPNFQIDYSLNSSSPCIDTGTSFYQVGDSTIVNFDKNEYYGKAPDMGAFESNYSSNSVKSDSPIPAPLSIFPNPFNSSTTIHFSISHPRHVHLAIYTITGQKVIDLLEKYLPIGKYQTQWNGMDESGNKISSGVYIVRLIAGDRFLSKRIVYMK